MMTPLKIFSNTFATDEHGNALKLYTLTMRFYYAIFAYRGNRAL
jgi:hypothetical protein